MNFLYSFVVFISVFLIGFLFRKILLIRLEKHCRSTASQVDDIILDAVKKPSVLWCMMIAAYSMIAVTPEAVRFVDITGKALMVLGIFSITLVLSQIAVGMIGTYSSKAGGVLPGASLTQNIAKVVILVIGILVILNYLGISIAPIIATLGIGGLAVALALQDTLANMFAGFYIVLARQIKIGDYVKLDSGNEGYVSDITWRTTKIKMLSNNEILIPNSKLGQAIIINYHLPDKELAVLVDVGVHYDSDLKKVESVTLDVARQVLKTVNGAVSNFEPVIRYNKFADFSINFVVVLRAREFVDQYLIKHEFIKALHARYQQEKIVFPYPVTAINLSQEKAQLP